MHCYKCWFCLELLSRKALVKGAVHTAVARLKPMGGMGEKGVAETEDLSSTWSNKAFGCP